MELWMDVDAALSEVPVNVLPLVDDTDFKTREESVAYNASGLELIWHFTTTAGATSATVVTPTTGGDYDWVHQDGGMYTIEMPASGGASINNDTEGFGWFTGVADGVLPWRGPTIGFRAAAVNNALIDGGDTLDVSVTQWNGTAVATPATAGYPAVTLKVGTGTGEVNLSSGKAPATIAAGDLATDSLTADALAADAVAEINATVDTALADIHLDHLLAVAIDWSAVHDDAALPAIVSSSDPEDFDRTTDSLQTIGGKVAPITSAGVATTVGLISNGTNFDATRGKALVGIELTVPAATINLSGYNATFGVTRLVSDNAVTGDVAAEQFDFTINDPGGGSQSITGNVPKTSTINWTIDNDVIVSTHNPTGRAYRWSIDVNNSHTGTAQAGGASSITLAVDASDDDDFYNGVEVEITSGTGIGQTETISDYNGTTKVATIDTTWGVQPDNTSGYHVAASDVGCRALAKGEISVSPSDTNCGQPS